MTKKIEASPHWSLWLSVVRLRAHTFPAPLSVGTASWSGRWTMYTALSQEKMRGTPFRLTCRREGGRVLQSVEQSNMLYWNHQAFLLVEAVCDDDLLHTPQEWSTRFYTGVRGEVLEGTDGEHEGRVRRRSIELAPQSLARPRGPLSSTWSVMTALPGIVAEGRAPLDFACLEELLVLRPGVRLQVEGAVEVETAAGPIVLRGYRLSGRGLPPIYYWVDASGWPVLWCGHRRIMVAETLEALA